MHNRQKLKAVQALLQKYIQLPKITSIRNFFLTDPNPKADKEFIYKLTKLYFMNFMFLGE